MTSKVSPKELIGWDKVEKEFDELFGFGGAFNNENLWEIEKSIKDFIRNLLASERQRCVEAVEKLRKNPSKEATKCAELSLDYLSAAGEALQFFGYNQAIAEAKHNLEQLK